MPEASPNPPEFVTELQVSAHLMQLDAGVYCVYHVPGSATPDPTTGLPGARLTLPPGQSGRGVTITGFREDGWLGTLDAAALIRVTRGPAQVLMTIYQLPNSGQAAPKLQVTRLVEGMQTASAAQGVVGPPQAPEPEERAEAEPVSDPEIAAHVQLRGDVLARLGEWVGEPGSQRWVEGFAVAPRRDELAAEDIEYQAVLGRGWLSPWAEGGQYCGSRGMALPILGLRVRLRGKAAQTHTVSVTATFTDGASIGPVGAGEACEAESLAPLEAFRITLAPLAAQPAPRKAAPRPAAPRAVAPVQAKPAPQPVAPKRATRAATAPPAPKPRQAAPTQGRRR